MRQHSPTKTLLACALVVGVAVITLDGQYSLTVSKDRLLNAQNEPQNWLLMNGDYGSQRYSRLTQINRDNVGDLRMAWALAIGAGLKIGALAGMTVAYPTLGEVNKRAAGSFFIPKLTGAGVKKLVKFLSRFG